MPAPSNAALQFIRRVARPDGADKELLRRFARHADAAAFAALVARHGPMVLGVCRRILSDPHDADDAFQATFLVLVRRAGTLAQPDALAGWLHGVATRVSTRARADASRRKLLERRGRPTSAGDPAADIARADLRAVLDEEVGRLPEKYRLTFVLTYLDGKTDEEVGRLLGCPKGTVASRLAGRANASAAGWSGAASPSPRPASPLCYRTAPWRQQCRRP